MSPEIDTLSVYADMSRRHNTRLRRIACATGFLTVAASLTGVGSVFFDQELNSGSYECSLPVQPLDPGVDGDFLAISWNMHNEIPQKVNDLHTMVDKDQADLILMQEATKQDYMLLANKEFPGHYVCIVYTDGKTALSAGGAGNVMISRQKPEAITTRRMQGRSLTDFAKRALPATVMDVGNIARFDMSMKHVRAANEENRAAMAFTVKLLGLDGRVLPLRVVFGHVSPREPFHGEQFRATMGFFEQNIQGNRPLLGAVDMNAEPDKVIPEFERLGMTADISYPTSSDKKVIDYMPFTPNVNLGYVESPVMNYKTDHYAKAQRFKTVFKRIRHKIFR